MMIKILISLMAAGIIAGCTPPPEQEQTQETPATHDDAVTSDTATTDTVTAKSYVIKLDGNATTGYMWSYKMSVPDIVKEIKNDYKTNETPGMTGTPGVFIFEFVGIKPGTVDLDFGYARPWEKTTAPIESKNIQLKVADDLTITETK